MLCQGLRKFIPALTASDVKTCEKAKTENYFQTENCRSPDDPARRAAVHSFSFILGKGKSSAALPALKCCLFLKGITFKTLIAYNIIVIRVCIISNIIIKSIKKP